MRCITPPLAAEYHEILTPSRRLVGRQTRGNLALFDMESRPIFDSLSPLDHRYAKSNPALFEQLSSYLSESASVRYCARVEAALLVAHASVAGELSSQVRREIEGLPAAIDPEEVYQEEEKTRHNVRALVNVMRSRVPDRLRHLVHLGATSVDILDTALSMRIRDVVKMVILPRLAGLVQTLAELARVHAETPQVGRTHGQHAVPVTFGFAIAEYVARLGKSALALEERARDLRGKMAGAVGAYNAMSLIHGDPVAFEATLMDSLGLRPSEHSTQLVEPEHVLRVLLEMNTGFGILANLADDLRNLQRSEIGELQELFSESQVGSSTMPQKRNPWNSEHVKSLWKTFSPRVVTFFMDQISEHQRDLTNSASSRFIADYVAGYAMAIARMQKVVSTLRVDAARMERNLDSGGAAVLAEAAYLLLALSGHPDSHETIRKITIAAEERGIDFATALEAVPEVWNRISGKLEDVRGEEAHSFFSRVGAYRGRAAERARDIGDRYAAEMKGLKERLTQNGV